MRISVIIPTKNRREDLLTTLYSIVQQSRPPEEVIVVDQSREDCEKEVLELFKQGEKSNLIYIWNRDIPGPAAARTAGFNKSNGDIIFFVDDDVTLEKDCIENLLYSYETNPHLGGIGGADTQRADWSLLWLLGKSLFTCGPFSLRENGWFFTGWIPHYFHDKLNEPYPSQWLFEGIMSFKRHVVEEIKFDKQLTGHVFIAGTDFNYRASQKYTLAIDPRVKGYHRGGTVALYDMKEDHRKRVSGEWYFFGKNIKKTPLNCLFFTWRLFGSLLVALLISIRRGSLDPLRGFWAGMESGATQYRKAFSRSSG